MSKVNRPVNQTKLNSVQLNSIQYISKLSYYCAGSTAQHTERMKNENKQNKNEGDTDKTKEG